MVICVPCTQQKQRSPLEKQHEENPHSLLNTDRNKNSFRLQPESVYPWINKSHDWKWRLSHEKYGFLHDIVRSNETVNKHVYIMIKQSDPLRLPDIKMELTVEFLLRCNNIPRQLKGQRL